MDNLFCRTSSFSTPSTQNFPEKREPINSEEITIEDFQKSINNWQIPKIKKDEVYVSSLFKNLLKTDYVIKTEERDVTLSNPFETINLLSSKTLKKHADRNYNFIHIGLVQLGIKPLTREGLNTSILCVLRDARFLNFQDSIISTVESSLCQGPIWFGRYPNFSLSLKDPNIASSLTLQIKTHNYKMIEGSIPVAIIYRVHYKAMFSAFTATKNIENKKGETLFLQTDLTKANTVIPKTILWKYIDLPEEWILEGAVRPQPLEQ
ncbi:uncharacterized protein [Cicer arietinum]|uniref:uncharacterized protein n=1 Tax=Cicer arietinum TaxID=3827 RepID=UPI000640F55D